MYIAIIAENTGCWLVFMLSKLVKLTYLDKLSLFTTETDMTWW